MYSFKLINDTSYCKQCNAEILFDRTHEYEKPLINTTCSSNNKLNLVQTATQKKSGTKTRNKTLFTQTKPVVYLKDLVTTSSKPIKAKTKKLWKMTTQA